MTSYPSCNIVCRWFNKSLKTSASIDLLLVSCLIFYCRSPTPLHLLSLQQSIVLQIWSLQIWRDPVVVITFLIQSSMMKLESLLVTVERDKHSVGLVLPFSPLGIGESQWERIILSVTVDLATHGACMTYRLKDCYICQPLEVLGPSQTYDNPPVVSCSSVSPRVVVLCRLDKTNFEVLVTDHALVGGSHRYVSDSSSLIRCQIWVHIYIYIYISSVTLKWGCSILCSTHRRQT